MNIAVVGSGSIGLLIASELSKLSKDLRLTIFSGGGCRKGASMAAGAMINIASEVDSINRFHPLTRLKLDRYDELIFLWNNLFTFFEYPLTSFLKGEGTEVRYLKSSLNDFEKMSFESILSAVNEYKINNAYSDNSDYKSLLLPYEKSIDSNHFLNTIVSLLGNLDNVYFNTNSVNSLKKDIRGWSLLLENNNRLSFDYVILCAGSFTEKIINHSTDVNVPTIKSFYGIGSALNLFSELPYINIPKFGRIIRTPNRGGTCGIHLVERESSIYIGASSFINPEPIQEARSSSIINLFQGASDFLGIDIEKLSCQVITGFRPVTSDACPIIGELDNNLYCIYGTKRDGLTWSPYYAHNIAREVLKMTPLDSWHNFKSYCCPYREYNSAGTVDHCTKSYILSKKYEALQHNKILKEEDYDELSNISRIVHENNYIGKGIYPELINMFYFGHVNSKL